MLERNIFGQPIITSGSQVPEWRKPSPPEELDTDALTLRVSVLLSTLRQSSYAGAAYEALSQLERTLTTYLQEEQNR